MEEVHGGQSKQRKWKKEGKNTHRERGRRVLMLGGPAQGKEKPHHPHNENTKKHTQTHTLTHICGDGVRRLVAWTIVKMIALAVEGATSPSTDGFTVFHLMSNGTAIVSSAPERVVTIYELVEQRSTRKSRSIWVRRKCGTGEAKDVMGNKGSESWASRSSKDRQAPRSVRTNFARSGSSECVVPFPLLC